MSSARYITVRKDSLEAVPTLRKCPTCERFQDKNKYKKRLEDGTLKWMRSCLDCRVEFIKKNAATKMLVIEPEDIP